MTLYCQVLYRGRGACALQTPWDRPTKCPDYQGVLIFPVSLHDN